MARYPMTIEGEVLLRAELKKLKSDDRIKVVKSIAQAREFGDLKENAEYHAAKEQQAFIESRIREIEKKLTDSQVIDVSRIKPSGKDIFGCTVELEDYKEEKLITFKIVGEDESDVTKGKLSLNSPLAKNLIGKFEGDVFEFNTPGGLKEYEVISIKHL